MRRSSNPTSNTSGRINWRHFCAGFGSSAAGAHGPIGVGARRPPPGGGGTGGNGILGGRLIVGNVGIAKRVPVARAVAVGWAVVSAPAPSDSDGRVVGVLLALELPSGTGVTTNMVGESSTGPIGSATLGTD